MEGINNRKRQKRSQGGRNGSKSNGKEEETRTKPSNGRKSGSSGARDNRSNPGITAASMSSRVHRSYVTDHTTHIVCAISENLAKETCVASLDASAPVHLQVTKQGNGQRYAETLAYLQVLSPHEILINEGRADSTLAKKIMQIFSGEGEKQPSDSTNEAQGADDSTTVVKVIPRALFDQTKGSELLSRVARDESYDPSSVLGDYILSSSAHAVLHYTQQNLGATFARKSLHLEVNSGGTNRMVIDRSTLLQLELLQNAKTGKTRCSLIATIDYTKTSVGNRLLRTNLMSPPARLDTIMSRLDLVDAFLSSEDFFYTVLEHLRDLPCLDKMLANVALVPQKRSQTKKGGVFNGGGIEVAKKNARKGISGLVGIKTILAALPAFVRALEDRVIELHSGKIDRVHQGGQWNDASTVKTSLLLGLGGGPASKAPSVQQNHLLHAIIQAMKTPALTFILEAVTAAFTDSTTSANRSAHAMRHEECFALQAETRSMMSTVRENFLHNVDSIYLLADDYAGRHGFFVSVRYSSSRGYYLAVPEDVILPPEFIQPTRSGRYITCTTEKVQSLNIRAQDNYQDLLLMTDSKIQEILNFARTQYDALATLSDAIALLDFCHSNADCVTQRSSRPWCRPVLTCPSEENDDDRRNDRDDAEGALIIKNGRYVIEVPNCVAADGGAQEFVANHTYATRAKPFTVITGINGSGKSTYLKQIALIVILAHCGGYVPAECANIPIRDRLCTRIGNTDDPEHNISTFMAEMKETAFICTNANSRSLLLIDELGRATSNEDGVALAWAVSEWLLQSGALTFFATHYSQLTLLGDGDMYALAQNQHMEATVTANVAGRTGEIAYTHKVSQGPCKVGRHYGVDLARACGWPDEVLQEAQTQESSLRDIAGEAQLIPIESNMKSEAESLISTLKSLLVANEIRDSSALKSDMEHARQTFLANTGEENEVGNMESQSGADGDLIETDDDVEVIQQHRIQSQTLDSDTTRSCSDSCSGSCTDDGDESDSGSTESSTK